MYTNFIDHVYIWLNRLGPRSYQLQFKSSLHSEFRLNECSSYLYKLFSIEQANSGLSVYRPIYILWASIKLDGIRCGPLEQRHDIRVNYSVVVGGLCGIWTTTRGVLSLLQPQEYTWSVGDITCRRRTTCVRLTLCWFNNNFSWTDRSVMLWDTR